MDCSQQWVCTVKYRQMPGMKSPKLPLEKTELGTKVQRNGDRAAALGKWQFMFSILIC